jgi:hypothetical protein
VIRFGHSDVNGLDGALGVAHTLPVLSGPIWRRLIEGTAPGPLGMSGQWSLKAGGRNTLNTVCAMLQQHTPNTVLLATNMLTFHIYRAIKTT